MQPFDLQSAVGGQSWEWLLDLAPRLDIVVELIDAHASPVLSAGETREAAVFRRMLATDEPTLRSAMWDALRSSTQVCITVEPLQVACQGLATGGLLLVARRVAAGEPADEMNADLSSIATWLAGVIDVGFAQPSAVNAEPYRIVSFRRILHDATSRGSLHSVIGAFVEALSVWDDIRACCYATGSTGGFFQYGSSLSASPASFPDEIQQASIPRRPSPVRLSRSSAADLGVTLEPGDTLVCRIVVHDLEWLLLFSGMIDDREQVRLRVYSDMLRESLSDILKTITNRLVAGVSRPPLSAGDSLDGAAEHVLGQLTSAVGGVKGALGITLANNRKRLSVGGPNLLESADPVRRDQLVLTSSDVSSVMSVVIEREQPFAAFERDLVHSGVAVAHRWMQAALRRSDEIERRRSARPVEKEFDQLADAAVTAGRPASVIVVAVDETIARPGLVPTWCARIRAQLRAGDFAGILSDTEIAVLLCGASADQAQTVSARLVHMFKSDVSSELSVRSALGMITHTPDSSPNGSIVAAARAAASRRGTASTA